MNRKMGVNESQEIISVKDVAIERCDGNLSRRTWFHTLLDSLCLCLFVHLKGISPPLDFLPCDHGSFIAAVLLLPLALWEKGAIF